jgi:hypothetical protein
VKLAVVAGGWHWSLDFYEAIQDAANEAVGGRAHCCVIAHRDPELPIVREEKREALAAAPGRLGEIDRYLYGEYASISGLRDMYWKYEEHPNTVGDWGFFNQWLATHDYHKYDVILNLHDDTFVRRFALPPLDGDWLLMGHGKYPQAPDGYVRGSLEFWKPELLDMLGGKIDLGDVKLTREGLTDSPVGMEALSPWNDTAVPLRNFMRERGLLDRIKYLSPHYRVSPWFIEGERGFLHKKCGAPWSFEAGLKEWPI